MEAFSCLCVIIAVLFFLFCGLKSCKDKHPMEWPLVGITAAVLPNVHRLHDKFAEIFESSGSRTFLFKSNYVLGYDMLVTCDPANVHYVMNSQFSSYPKGMQWRKRFEIFEDSVFNFDFEEWSFHRSAVRWFLNHQDFNQTSAKIIQDTVTEGLIPFLENACQNKTLVDLQDMFKNLIFDVGLTLITGFESSSLRDGIPKNSFIRAIDDWCEAIFQRHFLPEMFWRLQKWLQIGREKQMIDAKKRIHGLFHEWYSKKQSESESKRTSDKNIGFDALGLHLTIYEDVMKSKLPGYEVIRGNLTALLFAIEDTTSTALTWFFWLLSQNPKVELKLKEEISTVFSRFKDQTSEVLLKEESLREMVYLHASLCETLRLFPPAPLNVRTPVQADTIPSGHHVNNNTIIFLSFYGMGRMSSVWGDDCREFKPERWIADDGRIKHYPPHKFSAFSAGPRICPGKAFAFTLMKAIAGVILHNFDVKLIKDRRVTYNPSIILRMNGELMAKVSRRDVNHDHVLLSK